MDDVGGGTVHGPGTTTRSGLLACESPLASVYDLAVLDLDGVLYIGPDAVPGAPQALAAARSGGMRVCFVTNNAARRPETVAEHLVRLGVPATAAEVVTSAQVAAAMLGRRLPPGAAVLLIGGDGLRAALADQGLRPVASLDEGPQAVVQGFHPDLGWRDFAEATRAVRSGLYWLATNLDLTVPTPHGPAPGNGALVGLVAGAAGREPDDVAGKPKPGSFVEAAHRYDSARPLVVGDRLDTDLEGARAAGQDGLLVLTGVSGARDLLACPPHRRPAYLGRDLGALQQPHPAVTVDDPGPGAPVRARCGSARVVVADGVPRVEAGDDALDVLRAAAVACWAWTDAGGARAGGPGGSGGAVDGNGTHPRPGPARPPTVPDPAPVLDAVHRLEAGVAWAR